MALPVGPGLDAAAQQPPHLVEGIALVASVAKRFVLHSAADLVECLQT